MGVAGSDAPRPNRTATRPAPAAAQNSGVRGGRGRRQCFPWIDRMGGSRFSSRVPFDGHPVTVRGTRVLTAARASRRSRGSKGSPRLTHHTDRLENDFPTCTPRRCAESVRPSNAGRAAASEEAPPRCPPRSVGHGACCRPSKRRRPSGRRSRRTVLSPSHSPLPICGRPRPVPGAPGLKPRERRA